MDNSEINRIEYRVRPVTRYIVTRYADVGRYQASQQHGEFESAEAAYAVGYALCKAEHDRLGLPPADERIQYPNPPADSDNMQAKMDHIDANTDQQALARGWRYGRRYETRFR